MTIIKQGFFTPVDIDFRREQSQTFSSDATYSMGGMIWTKQNTAHEASAAAVGSSGLVFSPSQASDWNTTGTRQLPLMALRLRDVFNFNLGMGVRLWVYNPGNAADANYENAVWTIGSGNANYEYLTKRGRGLSGNGVSAHMSTVNLRNNAYIDFVTALDATNDVVMMEFKNLAVPTWTTYVGGWREGWPQMSSMRPVNVNQGTVIAATQLLPESIYVCLGAQRAGSGDATYTVTYQRMRVDVMP